MPDLCRRQGLGEVSFEEHYLFIEQTIPSEIIPHNFQGNRHVPPVPSKGPVLMIDLWKSSKRIRHPNLAVGDLICRQHGSHENCHSTAPDSRLDEIAVDVPGQYIDNAPLHMIELACPKHRFCILDTIPGFMYGFQVIYGA